MRRAFIGDIHACIDELEALYKKLSWESIDEIWHAGDLVDRGPASGAVIEFCRQKGIKGVAGNHDLVICEWKRRLPSLPKNPDKARTVASIKSEEDWKYLEELPALHVFDDTGTILVHGGLLPGMPLTSQPPSLICRLQLIHPFDLSHSYWFTEDRKGVKEEVHRANGYRRWYEIYDHEYDVVFGHSVFKKPLVYKNRGGICYGIDQGSVFGGKLTALILPERKFIFQDCPEYAGKVIGHD